LKANSKIFFVAVPNEKAITLTRKIFKQIKSKRPGNTRVLYEKVTS